MNVYYFSINRKAALWGNAGVYLEVLHEFYFPHTPTVLTIRLVHEWGYHFFLYKSYKPYFWLFFFSFKGWEEPSVDHQHLAANGKLRPWLPALDSTMPVLESQWRSRKTSQDCPPSFMYANSEPDHPAFACPALHPARQKYAQIIRCKSACACPQPAP